MINFTENVNLSGGADLNQHITISDNLASVDSDNLPQLNKPAIVTLYNLNFQDPVILSDGEVCADCSLISNNGNISFSVSHFSNYSVAGNSELAIWDNTDTDRKEPNDDVFFFANYTNMTSGESINGTGIACEIIFDDTPLINMSYNESSRIYYYQRTFTTNNSYNYNISCNGSVLGFDIISLSDTTDIAPEVYGSRDNYTSFYTRTRVNVSNAMPEILNISCNNNTPITLTAGYYQEVICDVLAKDNDGGNTITMINGSFYYSQNSSSDPDDNNTHYTNASCSQLSVNGYNTTWRCSFNIWYYANNGTWRINATVIDSQFHNINSAYNASILPMYAINVTPIIDYGSLAVGDTSSLQTANVTNLGNMRINVSVYAFGGDDELTGTGVAMICDQRNISLPNERYSLDSLAAYGVMTPITGTATNMQGLNIAKQTSSATLQTNSTYWMLHINITNNPSGVCNGTVIFSAEPY
jgi:hypothetical protein